MEYSLFILHLQTLPKTQDRPLLSPSVPSTLLRTLHYPLFYVPSSMDPSWFASQSRHHCHLSMSPIHKLVKVVLRHILERKLHSQLFTSILLETDTMCVHPSPESICPSGLIHGIESTNTLYQVVFSIS